MTENYFIAYRQSCTGNYLLNETRKTIKKPMEPKKAETMHSWDVVFPNDTNPYGTMFGGKLMAMMDIAAGITASRYSNLLVVTAASDTMIFKEPLYTGDHIEIISRVVYVGRTSIMIKVDVFGENPLHAGIRKHCTAAHFTFIAVDQNHRPVPVTPLLLETDEEKREYMIAENIKKQTLDRKRRGEQTATDPVRL
jgi:acyl-CoA hydrolase